jgi:outer membrane protein assembly factor BamA
MRSLVVFTFVGLAFVGSFSFAAAQDSCDEQFVVSQVNLPTTTQLLPREQLAIRARLIGNCFGEQQVDELADQVRDALQTFGYFRATVSEPAITIADGSRHPQPVSLKVEFAEGARYRVRDVVWSGMKALTADQLFSLCLIRPGDILDTGKIRETLETVRRLYVAVGYPKASIVSQIEGAEDVRHRHLMRVRFSVLEGSQSP